MGCVNFRPKQAGSGDPSPENIRPISGYELAVGKNLFNPYIPIIYGVVNSETGIETLRNDRILTDYIPIEKDVTYTISVDRDITGGLGLQQIYYYDKNKSYLGNRSTNGESGGASPSKSEQGLQFTPILEGVTYVRFSFRDGRYMDDDVSNVVLTDSKIQLEKNSIATEYEPFTKTIYGGYLDVDNSELVDEWKQIETITSENAAQYVQFYSRNPMLAIGFSYRRNLNHDMLDGIICDKLQPRLEFDTEYAPYMWVTATNGKETTHGTIMFELAVASDYPEAAASTQSANEWCKTRLAQLEPTFCLSFGTPIHYQLDPIQLEYNMSVLGVKTSSGTLNESRRRIILSQPHLETTTGSIATFDTDMKADVKSLKVHFAPVQEGTGDPSPTNVRPITGWTGFRYRNTTELQYISTVNYTTETKNGLTLVYLGSNTFSISGVLSTTSFFDIPIESFVLEEGCAYIATIYELPGSGILTGRNDFVIALRQDSTSIVTVFPNAGRTSNNRLSVDVTLSDFNNNYTINTIRIVFASGTANGTFAIHIRKMENLEDSVTIYTDFVNEAGTVYGGYLDLINGELVATDYKIVADGINVKANSDYVKDNLDLFGAGIVYLNPPGKKANHNSANTSVTNILCNKLPVKAPQQFNTSEYTLHVPAAGSLYVVFYVGKISEHPEVETKQNRIDYVNSWLQENPTTIVYELATPIHYQLTPEQIKTLKGSNNVFSDTNGDVEVEYWTH